MLTKTLRFDEAVLFVLRSQCAWGEDGKSVVITAQLDRKLYEKVNKALEAMGGKWSRKEKAHIFPEDPRPSVEGLIKTGEIVVDRDGFFETPEHVVVEGLRWAGDVGGTILEPEGGEGAIIRALIKHVDDIDMLVTYEKNEKRAEKLEKLSGEVGIPMDVFCGDFLLQPPDPIYDLIFMNPPFEEGQDIDHVRHAYNFLTPNGVLIAIMGEGAFFRTDKKAEAFRLWLLTVGGISSKLPEGSFKASGTMVNTRMVKIVRKDQ